MLDFTETRVSLGLLPRLLRAVPTLPLRFRFGFTETDAGSIDFLEFRFFFCGETEFRRWFLWVLARISKGGADFTMFISSLSERCLNVNYLSGGSELSELETLMSSKRRAGLSSPKSRLALEGVTFACFLSDFLWSVESTSNASASIFEFILAVNIL